MSLIRLEKPFSQELCFINSLFLYQAKKIISFFPSLKTYDNFSIWPLPFLAPIGTLTRQRNSPGCFGWCFLVRAVLTRPVVKTTGGQRRDEGNLLSERDCCGCCGNLCMRDNYFPLLVIVIKAVYRQMLGQITGAKLQLF